MQQENNRTTSYAAGTEMISVIVPVYNILEYLPRCVHSLTAQTYRKLEILLVDDGSTDGTGDLCDELAKEDDRIRVFHKENGGSSSARNFGLLKARGDYVAFVDSDDYVDAGMYERLHEAAVRNGVAVAQAARDEIDEEGNKLPNICEPPACEELWEGKDFLRELLMHRGDCSFCTKLIRRELFFRGAGIEPADDAGERLCAEMICESDTLACSEEKCKTDVSCQHLKHSFPLGVLNEDFHLLLEMLPDMEAWGSDESESANPSTFLVSLPEVGYHVFYRMGSNSRKKSRNQFSRVYADNVDNADFALRLVKERYPDDAELQKIAFRFGMFQRLDYLLHIPVDMMKRPAGEDPRKGTTTADGPSATGMSTLTCPESTADGSTSTARIVKDPQWNTYFFYKNVVCYVRRNLWAAIRSPYLTGKNKLYLTLFSIAPRTLRVVHKKLRHIDEAAS